MVGSAPTKIVRKVARWIATDRSELLAMWEEFKG